LQGDLRDQDSSIFHGDVASLIGDANPPTDLDAEIAA